MTLETNTLYDPNTPHTAHEGFAATMYGEIFRGVPEVLNVASGRTDLGADLRKAGIVSHVTSLDPIHAYPKYFKPGHPDFIHGFAQEMPFADESFDMTLCQFGAQHIPEESLGDAIREMVRVTRTAEGPNDSTKGAILINPVFKVRKLQQALADRGLGEVAGLTDHDPKKFALSDRRLVRPTLWIQKTEALTAERLEEVVAAVVGSGALTTRRTLGELVSRANGGRSKY